MADLAKEKCVPCSIGTLPLNKTEIDYFMKDLSDGWEVLDELKIEKKYKFDDFKQALEFVNQIGVIAEEEGHHPDLCLGWGRVKVSFTTHKIKGLSGNDFIMAAKIDEIW